MGKTSHPTTKILTLAIKAYQFFLRPLIGSRCRFYPSCSTYAIEAIQTHGSICGCYLSIKRLFRCHPWNPGGIDQVPEKKPIC